MLITEGEKLKTWVKSNGYKAQEVADVLGISRQAVYDVYKVAILSNSYKIALKSIGFDVNNVKILSVESNHPVSKESDPGYLNQYIKALEAQIELLKDKVEDQKEKIAEYESLLHKNAPKEKTAPKSSLKS